MNEMAGKYNSYRKNLHRIAEDIRKDILPFLSAEERVRGLTLEERLRGLNPKYIRNLDAETQEKLKQLMKSLDGKQT